MALSDKEWAARNELAQQFLHADLTGGLTPDLANILADVALSWCRGHIPDPPADFEAERRARIKAIEDEHLANRFDDTDHLNDRSYYD